MQPIFILQPISSTAASVAEIQVPIAGQIKIGRAAGNDFSFPNDTQMSSVHFELSAEAGCCRARDLGSSNGLFLNTERIAAALLVEGDELQAGESQWRVVVRGGQPAPHTAETPLDQSRGYAPTVAAAALHSSPVQADAADSDLQLTSDRGVIRVVSPSETLTVGRTALANWVFAHDGQMSSIHLELYNEAEAWRVRDLGSTNGTFLNESPVSEARLRTGDEIRAGQTRFVVVLRPSERPSPGGIKDADNRSRVSPLGPASTPTPASPVLPPVFARPVQPPPTGTPHKHETNIKRQPQSTAHLRRISDGREYELPAGTIVQLGRGCGLPISLPEDLQVSTQHASLMFDGQNVQLQDTGSSNGTYVGGQRVTECQLADGQRFRVGQTELLVCVSQAEPCTEQSRPTVYEPAAIDDSSLPLPAESYEPTSPINPPNRELRDGPVIPVQRFGGSDVDRVTHEQGNTISSAESPRATLWSDEPPRANQPADIAHHRLSEQQQNESDQRHDLESQENEPDQPYDLESQENESDQRYDSKSRETKAELPASETSPVPISEPPVMSSTNDGLVAAAAIDWERPSAYAKDASEIEGVVCRSGLIVYRGQSSGLDPVDVGLSLLQITSGWVLNGSEIENWMEAARQGLKGLPREWLNPAKADDASWMLPFLSNWGSGKAWLVFASVDLDDALQKILSLRPISEDAPPLMPALTPQALANFLAEHDQRAVERFFQPFDAIMVEIRPGQRWALFSRQNLQAALRQ